MMPLVSALPTHPRGVPAVARFAAPKRLGSPALPGARRRQQPVAATAGLEPALQQSAAAAARWASQQPALVQSVASVALCMLAARGVADQLQRRHPGVRNLRTLDIASGVGAALGALALGHRALVAHGAPPWAPSAALWGATLAVGLWGRERPVVAYCMATAVLTAFATGMSCLGLTALNLLVCRGVPAPLAVAVWAGLPAGLVGYQAGR